MNKLDVLQQEKEIQFVNFTNTDAWNIAQMII